MQNRTENINNTVLISDRFCLGLHKLLTNCFLNKNVPTLNGSLKFHGTGNNIYTL